MKNILAKIKEIKYNPLSCRELNTFNFAELSKGLSSNATFILKIDDKNQIALSWWVSAKRTRSYPYARVYDSLGFSGKKVTIIPIVKDEGKEGDRDFLQWDTISLMSLLGIYVIISYYIDASRSSRYDHKITNQKFDLAQVKGEIQKLLNYQSDPLHWNLSQIDNADEIAKDALKSYETISKRLNVDMHSHKSAEAKIGQLFRNKEVFMNVSRWLAKEAQKRESSTIQPKEYLTGEKGTITMRNYLGGNYYFTCDEVELHNKEIHLIDAKHTKEDKLPSLGDIKDGLIKMILFTNLEDVKIDNEKFTPVPILKLTTANTFKIEDMNKSQKEMLKVLKEEAKINNFRILLNREFIL